MKSQEEINTIKEEVKTMNQKLSELSEDELEQVTGGTLPKIVVGNCGNEILLLPGKNKCNINLNATMGNPCKDCPYN